MRQRATAFIGLGANLGDARAAMVAAMDALARWPQLRVLRVSGLYRTQPIDATGPDFLNAVAMVETELAPSDLLAGLHALEQAAGRERPYRNAPRTLDLDLLLYDDLELATPQLTLPHPRAHRRLFVLVPLAEIAPTIEIPGHGPASVLASALAGQAIEHVADAGQWLPAGILAQR